MPAENVTAQSSSRWPGVTVGFIGCGTIASAIVTGICTLGTFHFKTIILSPRNSQKATRLFEKFPNKVQIAQNNQDVIDSSDWIFLCVRPQDVHCLESLTFSKLQTIISLIATISNLAIANIVSPASKICRAVPLPPVAKHNGITAIQPRNTSKNVEILFTMLGGAVVVDDKEQLDALQGITSLMGPFYQLLHTSALWLQNHNVSSQAAGDYVGAFFHSIAIDALSHGKKNGTHGFEALVKEQTPNGLNENAIKELRSIGVYNAVEKVLDVSLERLAGKRKLPSDSTTTTTTTTTTATIDGDAIGIAESTSKRSRL